MDIRISKKHFQVLFAIWWGENYTGGFFCSNRVGDVDNMTSRSIYFLTLKGKLSLGNFTLKNVLLFPLQK